MDPSGRFRFGPLFFAMGFAATAAQILILRRLIVVFGGNELVSGLVFAGWLLWSGVGNVVAGRFADRIRDAAGAAAILLAAMALALPLAAASAPLAKAAAGLPPPAMAGLPFVVCATLLLTAPIGFLVGAAFTVACRLPATEMSAGRPRTGRAADIGRVYALDAIGSGAGGVLFSLLAVRLLSPMQSSFLIAALLIAAVGIVFKQRTTKLAALSLVTLLAACLWLSPQIDAGLASRQWRGFNPVAQRESLFANLMVTDNRGERTLFIDGRPAFSLPLPETYETAAHFPLIEHPDPKEVLIVGGGISGMIDQWRQWNLAHAYFARLDPEVTALEQGAMPSDLADLPAWVRIHHADGRRLIREGLPGGCRERCLDIIIVGVGDPDTAAADRYFTVEFFEEAARMLKANGILALSLLEPANVVAGAQAEILGIIRASLGRVFPFVEVLPLDKFWLVASREKGVLTDDPEALDSRLEKRGIRANFFRDKVLAGISPERIQSSRREIERAARGARLNTDLRPVAYHAGMMLWEARSGSGEGGMLAAISNIRWWMAAGALAMLVVLSVSLGRRGAARLCATWVLAAIGFASIAYEIVLIVHYQMSMGLLVWQIGLIITAFMAGAGAGTWLGMRWLGEGMASRRALALALVLFAAYLPLLFLTAKASFLLANFLAGMMSGGIYQMAASQLVARRPGIGRAAGIIESADHWGAALGAIAASVVAVPLFGLAPALLMGTAVLIAAAAVVAILGGEAA